MYVQRKGRNLPILPAKEAERVGKFANTDRNAKKKKKKKKTSKRRS